MHTLVQLLCLSVVTYGVKPPSGSIFLGREHYDHPVRGVNTQGRKQSDLEQWRPFVLPANPESRHGASPVTEALSP